METRGSSGWSPSPPPGAGAPTGVAGQMAGPPGGILPVPLPAGPRGAGRAVISAGDRLKGQIKSAEGTSVGRGQ